MEDTGTSKRTTALEEQFRGRGWSGALPRSPLSTNTLALPAGRSTGSRRFQLIPLPDLLSAEEKRFSNVTPPSQPKLTFIDWWTEGGCITIQPCWPNLGLLWRVSPFKQLHSSVQDWLRPLLDLQWSSTSLCSPSCFHHAPLGSGPESIPQITSWGCKPPS